MTTRVYTARISYRGTDRLDVTRKSAKADGLPFAPSWAILGPALRLDPVSRAYAWPQYAADYTSEMRASYRNERAAWDALLDRAEVTLVCYCTEAGMCHRRVLAEILARLGAIDCGERSTPGRSPIPA